MITSIIMHKCTPRSSIFPITSLGLWLYNTRMKDRVIVGLVKLGYCPDIKAVNTQLDDLRKYIKVIY